MQFKELGIAGAFLIEPNLFSDERGIFRRHYCSEEYAKHGIKTGVMQGNVSENPHAYTLRGFHYQLAPHAEGKTISCITGSIYDIVVDLRSDSDTYLKWDSVILDADNRNQLYVPPGCANAFLTTEKKTIIHYYMSELYAPNSYQGFSYKDPEFNFAWPSDVEHISKKDENLPNYLDSLKSINNT
jgi:dTDP-4-dehydrorhamnose 3,5-epimerase